MFTVKFYRFENGAEVMHAVACTHYSSNVDPLNKQTTITVYPGPTTENGIEWTLSEYTSDSFTSCYVENQAGKTIATYNVLDHKKKPATNTP